MPALSTTNGFWTSPHGRALPCDYGERTLLMGIVNATPDSFSDGGNFATPEAAREHAIALVRDGADILDLGAESTRPGASPVGADEELRRLLPALKAIRAAVPEMPISVDTYHPDVAEAAIACGADIINDIRGIGAHEDSGKDYAMGKLAARLNCPLIAMHNRSLTDCENPADFDSAFLADMRFGIERILDCGVPANQLWVDPGFGFGKTPQQNLRLVGTLRKVAELGFPVLLGTSRKSTLGIVLGGKPPLERGGADSACAALGAFHGAACLRLHDVAAHRDVVITADAVFKSL